MDIAFEDTVAFVTDSAAYCRERKKFFFKKAQREVLSNVFINSYHVLCLAYILNLVGEVHYFHQVSLFKKANQKSDTLNGLKVLCLRNM